MQTPIHQCARVVAACTLVICIICKLYGVHANFSSTGARAKTPSSQAVTYQLLTKPIETIRCGQRVVSNVTAPDGDDCEDEPSEETWSYLKLSVTNRFGEQSEVCVLRPNEWFDAIRLKQGTFHILASELDPAEGHATITVSSCPTLHAGPGKVVTGTFRHTARNLVCLHTESGDQITCTAGHPFWKTESQSFEDARAFSEGDHLQDLEGNPVRVLRAETLQGPTEVYNIEVNRTHTYHVGHNGILTHNIRVFKNCDAIGEDDDVRERPDLTGKNGQGRDERIEALEIYAFDDNQPSHVRGWLKNEFRRLLFGNKVKSSPNVRTPPGYVQGHGRATPAREGYDYHNSDLTLWWLNQLEEIIRRKMKRP